MPAENRILATDAEFVDIIHTNSGNIWEGAVSLPEPLGQVDFYPCGGTHQNGCVDLCWDPLGCIGFDLLDFFLRACSHRRAHEIYVESIYRRKDKNAFKSTACDSYENFEN